MKFELDYSLVVYNETSYGIPDDVIDILIKDDKVRFIVDEIREAERLKYGTKFCEEEFMNEHLGNHLLNIIPRNAKCLIHAVQEVQCDDEVECNLGIYKLPSGCTTYGIYEYDGCEHVYPNPHKYVYSVAKGELLSRKDLIEHIKS